MRSFCEIPSFRPRLTLVSLRSQKQNFIKNNYNYRSKTTSIFPAIFWLLKNRISSKITAILKAKLHLFSLPLRDVISQNNMQLHNVVGRMKSYTTKRYRELTGNPKIILWQRNFYEHVIRNDEDYAEKWQYIGENALKWNLQFDY